MKTITAGQKEAPTVLPASVTSENSSAAEFHGFSRDMIQPILSWIMPVARLFLRIVPAVARQILQSRADLVLENWPFASNSPRTPASDYLVLIRSVRKTTGLVETTFQGCYAGNVFEIPYGQR